MTRHLIRCAIAIWIVSTSIVTMAENTATLVRVLDVTESQGDAGVVLLVNPDRALNSRAFITDADGRASVPHLNCSICTITAMDPTGSFFDKTTEFDSRSKSVTIILQLRPVIDRVFDPGAIEVSVRVDGPSGEPLPKQQVVFRPTVMTLDANWFFKVTTDPNGMAAAQLPPGEYTVATFLGGKPWEAPFRVAEGNSKCAEKVRKCIDSSLGVSPPKQHIAVQLSAASSISQ
jgi:hypothetical protein